MIDTAQFAWLFWWTLGVSLGACLVAALLTMLCGQEMGTRLQRRWCAWRGHDLEFCVEPRSPKRPGRIWLRCLTCGYRSPGLTV